MSDLPGSPAPKPRVDPREAPSAALVLGGPTVRLDPLDHNPLNAVTGGIWRVVGERTTAIAKVITDGRDHDGPAGWAASTDPSHWNWWHREVSVYEHDVPGRFRSDGIDAPRLLALDPLDDGVVVLWLEDVATDAPPPWTLDDLTDFARRLGRAQGRLAGQPMEDWLSRGFLQGYAESKPVPDVFDDDELWTHPLVGAHLLGVRSELARLHEDRFELYALVSRCPSTLCHLDVWPANLLRRADATFVLLDWAFCGDGAVGEDIANLVPDAVFDLLVPVDQLDDLAVELERSYLRGLDDVAWDGDRRAVRLAIRAAAAKYHWLGPRMVEAAERERYVVYGGREVDADELYRVRGAGLALLVRWAREARDLAADLGW